MLKKNKYFFQTRVNSALACLLHLQKFKLHITKQSETFERWLKCGTQGFSNFFHCCGFD